MRITIFTAGSRGDIQPCVVLGRALQQAGFDVTLAAPENFAGFIQENALCFHPLRGDVQQIMAGETGRSFMENGSANPIKQIRAMRTMIGPVALQMAEDALEACRGSEALICLAVFAPFGGSIAEMLGIPLINVEPTPLLPTRAFPAPGWPLQMDLGGLPNRLSGHAMLQVIWGWYGTFVNSFRQRSRLRPYTAGSFFHILKVTPLLGAYSSRVIPHPPDWPESMHITGYWFQESRPEWAPPDKLQAFLDSGDPPVYVGFGSMAGSQPEQLAQLILQALVKSGQRGLLLTGWGGMQAVSVPDSVYVLDSAPHTWLFPRMAAVVHHGGAGTTAEGLRAGVPSVILPYMMDQTFWGKRVSALGVGPEPIPRKKLTADNLAGAIQAAVTGPEIRQRAARLGEAIRAEDGVGEAVRIVKRYLGA
jgi:UDP:flavonoid glycosyltransferase YjiC (YdhE family)